MYCPVCDGEGEFLGQLGNLEWYRCRNCGIEFHVAADEEEATLIDLGEAPTEFDK